MKRGPKPKPNALKRLTGNPGKRPLNDAEPVPQKSAAVAPAWLTKDAREVWERVAPQLAGLGILTELDEGTLARYCTEWTIWHKARKRVNTLGVMLETTGGNYMQNPAVGVLHSSDKILRAIEAEFGMTPSSRSRVKVETGAAKLDPLDLFKLQN